MCLKVRGLSSEVVVESVENPLLYSCFTRDYMLVKILSILLLLMSVSLRQPCASDVSDHLRYLFCEIEVT